MYGRRARTRPVVPLPRITLRHFSGWLYAHRGDALPLSRLALSLLAVAHLALFLLLPGGRNVSLGWDASAALPHLTYLRAPDAYGFPGQEDPQGFVRFEIYDQEGEVRQGVFPSTRVKPNLRYQRWAAAGDAVSASDPALHERLLSYLLESLNSPPLRVELFAGSWQDPLPPPDAIRPLPAPHQRKVGSHDGLTRSWTTPESDKDEQ